MGLTGSVILSFLVLHLQSFWYGYKFGTPAYATDSAGLPIKDMYTMVVEAFGELWYSGLYVVAVCLLGIHLNHGFQSAFQSVGLRHKKYTPTIKMLGTAFSILITLGFISFPIYFFIIQL